MDFNSVNIEIGEKTRKLVGTMKNIYDIEENVGSISSLISKSRTGGSGIKVSEMIDIIYYGLNGNGDNRLERPSIENAVFKQGYISFIGTVVSFLLVSLSGGQAQEKGVQGPEAQTQDNPTSSTSNSSTE